MPWTNTTNTSTYSKCSLQPSEAEKTQKGLISRAARKQRWRKKRKDRERYVWKVMCHVWIDKGLSPGLSLLQESLVQLLEGCRGAVWIQLHRWLIWTQSRQSCVEERAGKNDGTVTFFRKMLSSRASGILETSAAACTCVCVDAAPLCVCVFTLKGNVSLKTCH